MSGADRGNVMMLVRILAAAALVAIVGFFPWTVWRCEAQGAGLAGCRIERAVAGLVVVADETLSGIARAEPSTDGSGIRLFDARERIVHEREATGVVGTRMTTLARDVTALARGTGAGPLVARQWHAAALAAVVVLGALVVAPLLKGRRRAQPATTDVAPAGAIPPLAIGIVTTLVGLGILWLSPVVTYTCRGAEAGAACVVERRFGGVLVVDRLDIDGIAGADGQIWETKRSGRARRGKENVATQTHSRVELAAKDGTILYAAETGGTVGSAAPDIAARVEAVAGDAGAEPFRLWHMTLIPALFATAALLIGLPILLALALRRAGLPGKGGLAFATVALALGAGWVLAVMGQ